MPEFDRVRVKLQTGMIFQEIVFLVNILNVVAIILFSSQVLSCLRLPMQIR